MNLPPVLAMACPLFRDIHHCHVQHFQKTAVRWEYHFGFGHFPKLAIKAFYRIYGINEMADGFRILEISGKICPVIFP